MAASPGEFPSKLLKIFNSSVSPTLSGVSIAKPLSLKMKQSKHQPMSSTQKVIAKLRTNQATIQTSGKSKVNGLTTSKIASEKNGDKPALLSGNLNTFFEAKTNAVDNEAFTMDDDEASVKAGNTNSHNLTNHSSPTSSFVPILSHTPNTRGTDAKEHVIKFVFRPQTSRDHTHVANTHYAILKAITDLFPETKVFDNYGRSMHTFTTIESYARYLTHFKLHHLKPNQRKQRAAIYFAYHRIRTTVPINELRRHADIETLLSTLRVRMTVHMWNEDETQISNLGFHVGVDPSNYLQSDFETSVREAIEKNTGTNKRDIPPFKCGFTTPYLIDQEGSRSTTKSYDIQCNQSDSKLLIKLLKQTYAENPTFMFHKLRHTQPNIYKKAIQKQNAFLRHTRIVPIRGVTKDVMWYMDNSIYDINGVVQILQHKNTESEGRWSIQTTDEHFDHVKTVMRQHLHDQVQFHCEEQGLRIPESFPTPGLAFKFEDDGSASDGTTQTYVSACSTTYSMHSADYADDIPPMESRPSTQAWNRSPLFLQSSENTPPIQQLSPQSRNFDVELATQRENAQLKQQYAQAQQDIQELRAQISQMAQTLEKVLAATIGQQSLTTNSSTATTDDLNMSVAEASTGSFSDE